MTTARLPDFALRPRNDEPVRHLAVPFSLVAPYEPAGDQPKAIAALSRRLRERAGQAALLGVTGSGKTYTIANVSRRAEPTGDATTRLWRPSCTASSGVLPNIAVEYSSAITTITAGGLIPSRDTFIERKLDQRTSNRAPVGDQGAAERRERSSFARSAIYGLGDPTNTSNGAALVRGERIDQRE